MENLQIIERNETENNREYVYRFLRYNIMCLRMLPGEVIKENDIAQLLNVSRTPVHEAVLMLKENYLVDVMPQSSSKVSLVNLEMMREGYFLRNIIEPTIIRQIAGNVSPDVLKQLRDCIERQEQVSDIEETVDDFFVLDDEFHSIMYKSANKEHIWSVVKSIGSHFDRVRHMDTILMSGNRKKFIDDHKKIYQYLMLGVDASIDLEGFYESHIGSYKKDFNTMLSKYPDYFVV